MSDTENLNEDADSGLIQPRIVRGPGPRCGKCGRLKAQNFRDVCDGSCAREYAYRDQDAENDCIRHAELVARREKEWAAAHPDYSTNANV